MKICPNCGKKNSDKAKFCRYCGTKLMNVRPTSFRSNVNYTICPNCGFKNENGAKFCVHCGYQFSNVKNNDSSKQQPRYNQQWQQANESINKLSNYSSNYFNWFMNTLTHPLTNHRSNPYFGFVSFFLISIFIWVAEVLGRDSPAMMNNIDNLFTGNSPLKSYMENYQYTEKSLLSILILSIISVFLYVFAGYFGTKIMSNNDNLFSFSNHLANIVNINVILSLLLIIASLINEVYLASVIDDLINTIMTIGIALTIIIPTFRHNHSLKGVYVAVIASVGADIIQAFIVTIAGIMLQ